MEIKLGLIAPGSRVLVVEDNVAVGVSLVDYLQELGAIVSWSTTVDDALYIAGGTERIDLAIVDMDLHGRRSLPVIDRLLGQGIATVLCTGFEGESIEESYRGLPRLSKPFISRAIREVVTKHLSK